MTSELGHFSKISLYTLVAIYGVFDVLILVYQCQVVQGKPMPNPDGSFDDWNEQKIFFGISLADIIFACPFTLLGILLLLFGSKRHGHYFLALVSFWFLWANTMTTATSLKFENPRMTFEWFIVFPCGAIVGALFIAWQLAHLDHCFAPVTRRDGYHPV